MPRRRFAVALLPPSRVAAEVDTLRRAVGSSQVRRIPPHLTLVPPVNVRVEDAPAVHDVLAAAAAAARPFGLVLGPAASFAPTTLTVHLVVEGDLTALVALREAVSVAPLDRVDPRPFVPHVTLETRGDPDQVDACLAALDGVALRWRVESLVLLEHLARPDAPPVWVPVAEEPLGGAAVVGRGGLELAVRPGRWVPPDAADLLGVPRPADVPVADPAAQPLVVVARRRDGGAADGTLAGAAVGSLLGAPADDGTDEVADDGAAEGAAEGAAAGVARLERLVVAPDERGLGVGAQVLGRWCAAAAAGGAGLAVADAVGEGATTFLERHGFVPVAGVHVRAL